MSHRVSAAITLDASFGLAAWCGQPQSMGVAHCHNDVELNYLVSGDAVYRFGDQQLTLRAGDLCLFWAARPHQLLAGEHPPLLHWLTLPLAHFLGWGLPARLREVVLAGAALTCHHPSGVGGAGQIAGWQRDLASRSAERLADGLVLPPEQVGYLVSQTPPGRLGEPADIADAVALLVSPDARWVSGQNLRVTGGML